MTLQQEIEQILRTKLTIKELEIIDESHEHEGHAGARGGARHLQLIIVADEFGGKSPVARHQMIYSLIGHLIPNKIHALRITATAP